MLSSLDYQICNTFSGFLKMIGLDIHVYLYRKKVCIGMTDVDGLSTQQHNRLNFLLVVNISCKNVIFSRKIKRMLRYNNILPYHFIVYFICFLHYLNMKVIQYLHLHFYVSLIMLKVIKGILFNCVLCLQTFQR